MIALIQHTAQMIVPLGNGPDILDITTALDGIVGDSGIRERSLAASVVGSTVPAAGLSR